MAAVGINGRSDLRTGFCRSFDDLHTHLLSSRSTRSPRQVQLTLPLGVSRQRSPQPPFMFRQGDNSPSTTITQTRLDGQKQFKSTQKIGQMHSWGPSGVSSPDLLFIKVLRWPTEQACNYHSYLLKQITHTTSAIKWSGVASPTLWRTNY